MPSSLFCVELACAAVVLLLVPILLAIDTCRLGWAAIRALTVGAYRLPLRVYTWLHGIYTSSPGFGQQTAGLDLRCIIWTLQISLDKPVRVSTLKHRVTLSHSPSSPTWIPPLSCIVLISFFGCIRVSHNRVAIIPGFEQLTTVSARCFFQTFRHLSATRPTSSVLTDLRQCCDQAFTSPPKIQDLPSHHTMTAMADIHASFHRYWRLENVPWTDCRSSDQGLIPFARHIVDAGRHMIGIAQLEGQRMRTKRVPR